MYASCVPVANKPHAAIIHNVGQERPSGDKPGNGNQNIDWIMGQEIMSDAPRAVCGVT